MESLPDDLDAVWRALAHPFRRHILDALRTGPLTTGELTTAMETTRHHLLGHLDVLRAADLVQTQAEGRIRRNYLNPVPLRSIHDRWLSHYEAVWSDVLLSMKADLEQPEAASNPKSAPSRRTSRKDHRHAS